MAIYQFVIELIPSSWVVNKKHNVEELYDENDFYDLSITWKHYQLSVELKLLLSEILPQGNSWNKNLQLWGDEEHNDIQVRLRDDTIEAIKIRLDLRNNIENLKAKVVDLAKRLNCQLFFPDERKIVNADIDNLNRAIANSNAAKFVDDPKKILSENK